VSEIPLDDILRHLEIQLRHIVAAEEAEPVRASRDPKESRAALGLDLPQEGIGLDALSEKLKDLISATPATTTSRFFNQLFGGRDWAAVLGDMLVPVLNNSMYTYKAAGPHVLIEQILVEKMGRLMGYTQPGGIFGPGGSVSNLTALILARNEADQGVRDRGLTGRVHRVYTSAASHYSIRKSAGVAGIGRENVIKIPVDSAGRMQPAALLAIIQADIARGYLPTMVNATLGTTVEGAFDPILEIAPICRNTQTWLHLDGAWGSSMVLCPEYRHLFKGSEHSDSITWCAHKMMGVPLTASVLLTRRQELLTKHLNEDADYLFQQDDDWLNPGTRSLQCGRRNDVLKVWTAWQVHGDAGYAERIRHLRQLVQSAVEVIRAHPELELVLEPESLNVCFRVKGSRPEDVCRALHREGRILVGYGTVAGESVMRVIFVNPHLDRSDVACFFREVLAVSK